MYALYRKLKTICLLDEFIEAGGSTPGIYQLPDYSYKKIPSLPHVFGVKLFNGVIGNTVNVTASQKSKMAAFET